MTLNEIIERKKEEFEKLAFYEYELEEGFERPVGSSPCSVKRINAEHIGDAEKLVKELESFLEKAIRESVEEALREVRPGVGDDSMDWYEEKVEEFMK